MYSSKQPNKNSALTTVDPIQLAYVLVANAIGSNVPWNAKYTSTSFSHNGMIDRDVSNGQFNECDTSYGQQNNK